MSEQILVDLPVIDQIHAKAYGLLQDVITAPNDQFAAKVAALVEHTKAHFDEEQKMMEEVNLSSKAEHESEHNRILRDMNQFNAAIERGRLTFARAFYKNSLPELLENHIRHMDSALAAHIKEVSDTMGTDVSELAPDLYTAP